MPPGPTDRRHRDGGPRTMHKGWLLFMAISFVLNGIALYTLSVATKFQHESSLSNKLAFVMSSGLAFAAGTVVLALVKPQPGSSVPARLDRAARGLIRCGCPRVRGIPLRLPRERAVSRT